jgi:hypothetical protein
MGSDERRSGGSLDAPISIHAPAWGATGLVREVFRLVRDFNPRSRMGSDEVIVFRGAVFRDFNPRSRMGSDGQDMHTDSWQRDFNPRSRMGSDLLKSIFCFLRSCISIHAPAWGATNQDQILIDYGKFQSTLPHGERQQKTPNMIYYLF